MGKYRFYLPVRVRDFKSAEPDFSGCIYSLGASVGPEDRDLDGCTSFSCHSKLEHCSDLGLKANRSSLPLIWNLISLAQTSMCAFVVLKKGLPRMRGVFMSSCMSSTTKFTITKKFLFLPKCSRRFLQGHNMSRSTQESHNMICVSRKFLLFLFILSKCF